jgi:hypothetical protein
MVKRWGEPSCQITRRANLQRVRTDITLTISFISSQKFKNYIYTIHSFFNLFFFPFLLSTDTFRSQPKNPSDTGYKQRITEFFDNYARGNSTFFFSLIYLGPLPKKTKKLKN